MSNDKERIIAGAERELTETRNAIASINRELEKHGVKPEAGQSIEWEQPIPFSNVTVPPFPIECFPLPLKEYSLAVSEFTQTPVDMVAVAVLTVMAVCVQGKYKIQGKPGWVEPLNLYSVIVANPAERKSAIMNLATIYINEYEASENEKNMMEINRSKIEKGLLIKEIDGLMNKVAKGTNGDRELLLRKQDELTNFREIKPLRLLADDVTPEALTSLLATNEGKISAISSEGGIFEMLEGRYTQGVNIDTFLKAHCGDPIRVDRKGRTSEFIKEPCLTVLLSIQPQVLNGLIGNGAFRGRGLTARFLYSLPVSNIGNRKVETKEIPQEYKEQYREICFNLLDINKNNTPIILKLSEEAYSISIKFAQDLEPRLINDLEDMADFAGKLHGTVLRIAGILHVVNQFAFADSPIPKETMQDAIKIGYYFLEHARVAYQLMGADEQVQGAKYVLKKLESQTEMQLKRYSIFKMCRNAKIKKVDDIEPYITLLSDFNYLHEFPVEQRAGAGRKPDIIYALNPLYFKNVV